jgi:CRP-like cAMP-binding protein
MIKRKHELLVLGTCAALALVWAIRGDYLPHLEPQTDWLISISSLLTVASFSVRGMLALRTLAVVSQVFSIPYFLLQATPLWTPVGWTGLFMVINLYHIANILLERRPVKLAPDEERLYHLAFGNFERREFLRLLKVGKWQTADRDDVIFSEGDFIGRVVVPITGSVSAIIAGQKIAEFTPGELIGAAIVLTNQCSGFDARFSATSRYMVWSKPDIEKVIGKHPDLSSKLADAFNRHLVNQINKLALDHLGSALVSNRQPTQT